MNILRRQYMRYGLRMLALALSCVSLVFVQAESAVTCVEIGPVVTSGSGAPAQCQPPPGQPTASGERADLAEARTFVIRTDSAPFIMVTYTGADSQRLDLQSYVDYREATRDFEANPRQRDFHEHWQAAASVAAGFLDGFSPMVAAGFLSIKGLTVTPLKPEDAIADTVLCVNDGEVKVELATAFKSDGTNRGRCLQVGPLLVEGGQARITPQSAAALDQQTKSTSGYASNSYWRTVLVLTAGGGIFIAQTTPVSLNVLAEALATGVPFSVATAVSLATDTSSQLLVGLGTGQQIFRRRESITPGVLMFR